VLAVGVEEEDAAAAGEESSGGVVTEPDGARLRRRIGRGRIGAGTTVVERMMCLPGRIGRLHHLTGPTSSMRGCRRIHHSLIFFGGFIPACVCLYQYLGSLISAKK
jgi:hypothetical protein